jgi:putative ABC transport system permease protein
VSRERRRAPQPPRAAELLLRLILVAEHRDAILGDIVEQYRQRLPACGRLRAAAWYWRQVRESVWPSLERRAELWRQARDEGRRETWGRARRRRETQDRARLRREEGGNEIGPLAVGPMDGPGGRRHPPPPGHGATMTDRLVQDIRYSLRTLLREPGWTLAALLTLGLAIGATTAIFGVVNAVLLRPLPFEDPAELVAFQPWSTEEQESSPVTSLPIFAAWSRAQDVFSGFGAYAGAVAIVDIGEGAEYLSGRRASAGFFPALGVEPAIGRTFRAEEDAAGSEPVIVLGHGLWQQRFGGDPSIVGETIRIDELPHTIIGVMPEDFAFPDAADFYVSLARGPRTGSTWFLRPIGRLRDGLTFEQAEARLLAQTVTVPAEEEREESAWRARIFPLQAELVGDVRPLLMIFLAAVSAVLLIACINVANLMMARAAARQREHSVRVALGAGRWRLARQLITESTLLSLAGGAIGALIALALTRVLVAATPSTIPRQEQIGIDAAALSFTLGLAFVVGLAVGLAPAFRASRLDLAPGLGDGARGLSAGRAQQRLRASLVIAQVALAMVLLTGSGLLLRSFAGLLGVERGYDVDNVLAFSIALPGSAYPELDDKARFHGEALDRLRALPGVQAAALAGRLPYSGFSMYDYAPEGLEEPVGDENEPEGAGPDPLAGTAQVEFVTADFFATLAVPLLAGRGFDRRDGSGGAETVVVNEMLARRHWPQGGAVGRRLTLEDMGSFEIIGVVSDARFLSLAREPMPQVYLPYAGGRWEFGMSAFVRTAGDPLALAGPVRRLFVEMDDRVALAQMGSLESRMWRSVAMPRFRTLLIGTFGLAALILAVVGVYGVMAYAVTQRWRELGIRKALGADRRAVVAAIMARGLGLTAIGLLLGLWGAWVAAGTLESYLFGIEARDPLTFAGALALLAAASLIASLIPACRASRVDPVIALRAE